MSDKKTGENIDRFFKICFNVLVETGSILLYGICWLVGKPWGTVMGVAIFLLGTIFSATYRHGYVLLMGERFFPESRDHLLHLDWLFHFFFFVTVFFLGIILVAGLKPWALRRRYQKDLDDVKLSSRSGIAPTVKSVLQKDESTTKLTIDSKGIGQSRYEALKGDLESSFNAGINSIKRGRLPRILEIELVTNALARKISYFDFPIQSLKVGQFCVGESRTGMVTADMGTLPHLLIAGTTGGGKSCFFKQVLLTLLKSTGKIQFYLLDLKKGVEMRPFEDLPNVRVAKTEQEAVDLLEEIKAEMDRRFVFLEEKKIKEIIPEKHKMDKIVVGIDECSVLYTKIKTGETKKALIERARELTDELAKLSRAAGMHLILATQKVTKETIDTRIQENIGGRMCFRTNTFQGSLTVLGNKMAHTLPDIKGRGIWATGATFAEVQTPFITEEELKDELADIAGEFETGKKSFNGPILGQNIHQNQEKKAKLKGNLNENKS